MVSSLRIDATPTFVRYGDAKVSTRASADVEVSVQVTGSNLEQGYLVLAWDSSRAWLVAGAERTSLPAGSYKRSFDWRLRPLVPGCLRISIQVTAGRLSQRSDIPVEIETDT